MESTWSSGFDQDLVERMAKVHVRQGHALYRDGDHEASLKELRQARNLLPRDPYIHFMMGQVHAARGESGRALRSFRRVLAEAPRFIDAYYQLGLIYLDRGARYLARARDCFQRELEVYPSNGKAYRALSDVLARTGHPSQAQEARRKAAQFGYRTASGGLPGAPAPRLAALA